MNPQDTPTPSSDNGFGSAPFGADQPASQAPVQSSPEADAAALQAIEALESEDLPASTAGASISSPLGSEPAVAGVSDAPIDAIKSSLEPVASPLPINPAPLTGDQTTAIADTTALEASAAGAVVAAGAKASQAFSNTQAPAVQPASPVVDKKKSSNKLLAVLILVLIIIVAATAGYFVWQAL
jgi:hypothetical protein